MNKLKKQLNSTLFKTLPAAKVTSLFSPIFSGFCSILFFHRVTPVRFDNSGKSGPRIEGIKWMECSDLALEGLISYLLENDYNIISIDRLYEFLIKREKLKKCVVLTFDDGYLDNFSVAYPIFKKYGLPFTIYITTGFPEKTTNLSWYILEEIILKNRELIIKQVNQTISYNISNPTEKENVYEQVSAIFSSVDNERQNDLVGRLCDDYNIDLENYRDKFVLSWKQIAELGKDENVTIGAHTHNHLSLTSLDEKSVFDEIMLSKELIRQHTGKEPEHFAYPFGKIENAAQREFDIAKKCGFKTSATTRIGNIFPEHFNYMECLPRNMVYGDLDLISQAKVYLSGTFSALKYKFKKVVTL